MGGITMKISKCCLAEVTDTENNICPDCSEECETYETENDNETMCHWCNGTGMGMYDGVGCIHCKGTGKERKRLNF